MSTIDEVKQKIDIAEVIGQYVTLKKAGRNLTAPCPFHSEKHASFFVFPERQSWHCFGACGTGGDVFAFLMKKEGIEFGEALRMLAEKAGVTLPTRTEPGIKKEEKEEFYRANEAASLYYNNLLLNSPAAEKARNYIAKRGFTTKTIADFQLGFSLDAWEALKTHLIERGHTEANILTAGLLYQGEDGKTHDRFRGKLMIPIRDSRGRVTGFGARVLDDSEPKYINSPQSPTFDKSATLYGIDRAAAEIRKQDTAIIMEGYMDVITAHQNGITNTVAAMGTAITEKQVYTLKKLTRHLILALDADNAGSKAMLIGTNYEKLLSGDSKDIEKAPAYSIELENLLDSEIRVVLMPEGKDPDDVIREDIKTWEQLIQNPLPVIDYMLNTMLGELNLDEAKNQQVILEKFAPIIAGIKNKIRQSFYVNKIAKLLGQDLRKLETLIDSYNLTSNKKLKQEPKKIAPKIIQAIRSNPTEEYCLALLLQHPELKERLEELSPEYFESSENREIFNAYKTVSDVVSLKEQIDPVIHEHLDAIANKSIPSLKNNIEQKFIDCAQELKKRYLKNLAARKGESGDDKDDNARLEDDMEISRQLKELDARRSQKHNSSYGGTRS